MAFRRTTNSTSVLGNRPNFSRISWGIVTWPLEVIRMFLTPTSKNQYFIIRAMKRLFLLLFFIALPLAADEVARLHALFDKTWETRLRESPMFATSVGRHEFDDKLGSMTPADLERRHAQAKAALAELSAIDRAALPPNELVNADIFRRQLESSVESYELGDDQMPFNADSGFHTAFSR